MKSLFQAAIDCEAAGDFTKAYELLTQCLSDQTLDRAEIAFHCGWCLENNEGDKKQAIGLYQQAVEQAEDVVLKSSAAFRAGWILLLEKEYGKAAAALKTVIDHVGNPGLNRDMKGQAQYWYALSLEHLGRYIEAAQWYQNAAHLSATLSPESIYRKVICYNHVGNFEAALTECESFPPECPPEINPDRYAELFDLIKKEEKLLLRCLAQEDC